MTRRVLQAIAGAAHGGAESFFTRLAVALQRAGEPQRALIRRNSNRAQSLRAAGVPVAELAFGYVANSLALISDAVHNFSDVIALLLAWGAAWLAGRRPTQTHTYGYRRASILAALFNAGLLLVAVGGIAVEAINRLGDPAAVAS